MEEPKTLRQALDCIQEMLSNKPYSADLWDVLSAIKGPDCRNHRLKIATTCIIRDAAFSNHPCEHRSFYAKDTPQSVIRRKKMFRNKENRPHFRDHIVEAFAALGLKLGELNGIQRDSH